MNLVSAEVRNGLIPLGALAIFHSTAHILTLMNTFVSPVSALSFLCFVILLIIDKLSLFFPLMFVLVMLYLVWCLSE